MKTKSQSYDKLLKKVKQQENELLKLKNLVENSPLAMHFYILNDENELIFTGANSAADSVLGIDNKLLIDKTIEQAFPELSNTDIPDIYKKIAKGEIVKYSFEIPYSDDRFSGYYEVKVFSLENRRIAVNFFDISEKKKYENELIKEKEKVENSEEKYRNLINTVADAIFIYNPDTFEILEANKATEEIYGYSYSELIGMSCLKFSAEIDKSKQIADKIVDKGIAHVNVRHHKKKDGTDVFVRLSGYKLSVNNQDVSFAVCQDITDNFNKERALIIAKEKAEEREALINSFFDSTNEYMGVIDIFPDKNDLRYIRINNSAGKYLNKSPKDVEGKLGSQLGIAEDTLKVWIEHCIESKTTGSIKKFNYQRELEDGIHFLEAYVSMLQPHRFSFVVTDITELINQQNELKKAKEKSEENEMKYRQLAENTADFIYTLDLESRHTMVNESVCKAMNLKQKDIIGKKHIELGFPEDVANEWRKIHLEVIKTGKIHKSETTTPMPDGALRTYQIVLTPIYDNKKKISGIRGISRDITNEKKIQKEIIIAKEKAEEANKLKSEFLKNMSHEIRTPMNGIIGFSEELEKSDLPEEKRKFYSRIVQNSSHQLLRIIDDILEISILETKQEKLQETEFCLNDLLMELFSIFNLKSKERNIPLYLKKALENEQSYIISDKTKLNKILGNILENALKYTIEGFIEFGYFLKKPNLVIYVKDTGIGVSSKNYKLIFERFYQESKEISKKHSGLGLGLSISKENANLLGGDITLESIKGKGSTFYVTIPYKSAHIENNNILKGIERAKKKDGKFTVLIAEDEEVNYLYIEILFERKIDGNFNLIHAKNGKEAVEICTADNNIDLVLMDIKMPIMNGLEATEKIKSICPNLPIIAQTAYSTESDKKLALNHGCDDFISKPINREKLLELIYKYLNV